MIVGRITEADIQAYADGRLPRGGKQWLPPDFCRIRGGGQGSRLPVPDRFALRKPGPCTGGTAATLPRYAPSPPIGAAAWRRPPRGGGRCRSRVAALCGSGGRLLGGFSEPARVGTAALAREGKASYAVYASDAAHPIELAADQRRLIDSWFSERLSRPIRAPDLRAAGLKLVASRHGPVRLYLYNHGRGRRIALYVRPMEMARTEHMQMHASDAVRGWTWTDDGLGFGEFGDCASDALHGMARPTWCAQMS